MRLLAKSGGLPRNDRETAMQARQKSIPPVVGWLVCMEGSDRGRDYRIRSGNNFIGHGEEADIRIPGGEGVCAYRQAVLAFDAKNSAFYIAPGEGHSLTYLNGEPLLSPSRLKHGDLLEIGAIKLLFVPLCTRDFVW